MKRKDFIKGLGIAGAATFLPLGNLFSKSIDSITTGTCNLVQTETAGPYPLDLSNNPLMFRTDIRETQTGAQLNLKLKFVGIVNCGSMANMRVDVWHCSRDGYYSGYTTNGQSGSQNHVGETFLRGIQMTDASGEVEFITIFPGWYSGRICHIHFQVFMGSMLQATSQLSFPIAEKNEIFSNNPLYFGADPTSFNQDNVFSDGYAYQLATLTPNSTTAGYDSYLEIGINGTGTTGLQNLEPETGGQFKLLQNYPNPYIHETIIPFTLINSSDVKIELFDLMGKKIAIIKRVSLAEGDHEITVNIKDLEIPKGNYVYQIEVTNRNGVFRQCKMMTAEKE
ncbi:MAG TPA: T9SS type A sorting domain-containing protein [Saprospiraceae bacterium]|nr:T9SS type A sorting domain-containing protein [Saprospiraceae bacterium]